MYGLEQLDALRSAAKQAYEGGFFESATDLLDQCLDIDPGDARSVELLGMLQYSLGHYDLAVSSLEDASLNVPLRMSARVCLAHAYGRVGRSELSRDLLRPLIAEEDIPLPLLLQVATGLDQIDRPDIAIAACRRAIEIDENNAQVWYDMGYYMGRCGASNDAIERMARKAIALDANCMRYRVGLAGLFVKEGRSAEALELVKDLSKQQIESISCTCCLKRIIGLYEFAQDYRRVVIGRQHLVLLENCGEDRGGCS